METLLIILFFICGPLLIIIGYLLYFKAFYELIKWIKEFFNAD